MEGVVQAFLKEAESADANHLLGANLRDVDGGGHKAAGPTQVQIHCMLDNLLELKVLEFRQHQPCRNIPHLLQRVTEDTLHLIKYLCSLLLTRGAPHLFYV